MIISAVFFYTCLLLIKLSIETKS